MVAGGFDKECPCKAVHGRAQLAFAEKQERIGANCGVWPSFQHLLPLFLAVSLQKATCLRNQCPKRLETFLTVLRDALRDRFIYSPEEETVPMEHPFGLTSVPEHHCPAQDLHNLTHV